MSATTTTAERRNENRADTPRSTGDSDVPGCAVPGPGPGPGGIGAEKPEIYGLIADHEAGKLTPIEVRLGELPASVTGDMRRIAHDLRTLMGLRLAVGEDRPVPYASRWAAERMGWKDHRRAARALRRLCKAGVVRYAGSMPARGKGDGTRTYASPPLAVDAGAVGSETGEIRVEPVAPFQPAPKVQEQRGMERAVRGERLDPRVASGDGADGHHAGDASAERGGSGQECAE